MRIGEAMLPVGCQKPLHTFGFQPHMLVAEAQPAGHAGHGLVYRLGLIHMLADPLALNEETRYAH